MYNDYYLQEISNKLSITNNNLITIITNQNTIITNQEIISNIFTIGFTWVLVLLFALIFYRFFVHLFYRIK